MGTNHVIYRRLADAGRQLDGDLEYQFLGRPAYSQCHFAVERGLCADPVPDDSDVLGRDAGVRAGEYLCIAVSGLDQQSVHLLDGGQCDYYPGYTLDDGR